jgi:hypothetical protein
MSASDASGARAAHSSALPLIIFTVSMFLSAALLFLNKFGALVSA